MLQYPCTQSDNIYHSNKWEPPPFPFLYPDANHVIGHALVHTVDKTHVLFATLELIWLLFLNIRSFNFVLAPRIYLRFSRFRRSYVNRPVVVLTDYGQMYSAFLLDVLCSNLPRSFFSQLFVLN